MHILSPKLLIDATAGVSWLGSRDEDGSNIMVMDGRVRLNASVSDDVSKRVAAYVDDTGLWLQNGKAGCHIYFDGTIKGATYDS